MLELPISKETFLAACSNKEQDEFDALNSSELASLVLILRYKDVGKLSNIDSAVAWAEKTLAKLIDITNADAGSVIKLIKSSRTQFNPQIAIETLNKNNIFLMQQERIKERGFLTHEGKWNFSFQKPDKDYITSIWLNNRQKSVTLDQERVIRTFSAEPDELLHVQAVAGSGKTTLLTLAANHFNPRNVIVCALTWQQLEIIASKLPKEVTKLTYGQLADYVIQRSPNIHVPRFFERKEQKFSVNYHQLAKLLSIKQVGMISPQRVAEIATKTVARYCYSGDTDLTQVHIPKNYSYKLLGPEKAIIESLASELWKQTINPDDGINLPIRTYHRIKLWALSGEGMPTKFKHVFIDETHDLPKPIIEIIDNSSQGIVTLGDQYQSLGLSDNMASRHARVRKRNMSLSYRVGKNSSGLFNHVLGHHPEKPAFEFEGRYDKTTAIIPYTREIFAGNENGDLAILSNSAWHLLRAILLLQSKNAGYKVIAASAKEIKWLIADAISLYELSGSQTSHREFYKHNTFDSFLADQAEDTRRIIEKTICSGFKLHDLEKALNNQTIAKTGSYVLGLVQDSKNTEFSRVMLLNDLLRIEGDSAFDRAVALNKIYLGASRAINEIYIPGHTQDWISDVFK